MENLSQIMTWIKSIIHCIIVLPALWLISTVTIIWNVTVGCITTVLILITIALLTLIII